MTRPGRLSLTLVPALAVLAVALASGGTAQAPEPPGPSPSVATPAASPTADPPRALHHGIDVSSHSGAVDWPAVRRAGHSFAFIKASEGIDLPDPEFEANWRAAGEAGLVRGAYHFYVTEDDPHAQAMLFISRVALEPGDLAPVVDIELIGHGTSQGLAERLRRFLGLLETHYGVPPIIYTAPTFWNAHLDDSFGRHPLWIAEYEVESPTLPKGWDRWHLWQWQGDAAIPGVEKTVDLSRVNRETDDLHRLFVPEAGGVRRPAR